MLSSNSAVISAYPDQLETNHLLKSPIASTFVIIDSNVKDYQALAAGILEGTSVAILESDRDGIEQITEILLQQRGITDLHILSHGAPGCLYLGNNELSLKTIDRYISQLSAWKISHLFLYGCHVAAGDAGASFIGHLKQFTHAEIAATTTFTGNAALGGNWNFEITTGNFSIALPFHKQTLETYSFVMPVFQNVYYGVFSTDGGSTFTQMRTVDLSTGTSTVVSGTNTTLFDTAALSRGAHTGRLYYIERVGTNPRVAYYDTLTGIHTLVGTTGTSGITFIKMAEAADGTIWATTSNNELYTINPGTGQVTLRYTMVFPSTTASGDIAFDPTNPNRLYVTRGVSSGNTSSAGNNTIDLYRIDLNTSNYNSSTTTLVGNTGQSGAGSGALAFGNDGKLYSSSNGNLITINTSTAAVNVVSNSLGSVGDFATMPIAQADPANAPNAVNDSYIISPNTSLEIISTTNGILTNDSDPNGDTLTIIGVTQGANGTVTFNDNQTPLSSSDDTITYTPNAGFSGTDTFTYTIGDGKGSYSIATVTVTVDSPPVLDLDQNNSTTTGNNYATTFTENGAAVSIADTDTLITDPDDTNIESATIVLTNAQVGDVLSVGTLPSGISSTINTSVAGQITVTLTGSATKANYQTALNAIKFSNPSETPSTTARTINITISDGTRNSNTAVSTINVLSVNDPPTIDLNGGATGTGYSATYVENGVAISIADNTAATIGDLDGVDINTLTLSVTGIQNGASEKLSIGGKTIALSGIVADTATSGTTTFAINANNGVVTITRQGGGDIPSGDLQTLLRGITYQNTGGTVTGGNRTISLIANDGTANSNTAVSTITVTTIPTIAITSDKTALKAGETATITFTLSEASTDFIASDVTVSGGTLSGFSGSGTTYTATFTPTANSTTNGVINVSNNKFSNAAGNQNVDGADANNTVTMAVDTVLPTIAITSDKSALKSGDTATLTFTLSEASTNFDATDIVVSGGTLSNFTGSGTTYTATFTPTTNSTTNGVISVASNKFSDAAGNQNNDGADANNTASLTIDTVLPTIAITSDKSALKAGDTATLTFTLSEASTNFDATDVVVSGGTLSNFSGSGTTYAATFTPTANSTTNGVISVASNKFSDAAGNQNNDGADANNTASLSIDTVLPTIAITSDKSALKAGDTATLTFTLSEASTNFDATDVVVSGGTLSNFTGSGTTYTATFTPTANSTTNGVISVASNKFSDAAGNQNNDGADANNTASLSIDTVLPTIAITSDKSSLNSGDTATITFTLSESSNDFDATDIVVSGGILSNFTGSGTTYTATFTPTANSTTNGVINVASNKFSDAAGNQNNDGAEANNTATLTVNTLSPTVTITLSDNALIAGETGTVTFSFSEAPTGFDPGDITAQNGTITGLTATADPKVYTATFTPTVDIEDATNIISVGSGYTNAVGNIGTSGTSVNYTIDTLRPTIAITSDKSALKASDTATLTFTLSEASTDFDASDIAVTGGTLSNFSGSGTTYTATFTPTANSTTNGVISVASNKFSDAAGNQNNDGADANNTTTLTVDTVLPTIAITSDKSALKAGDTATLTFTLSESSTDFDASDIVVSGGTLSNFTGSGTTYTATFTPTADSTTNGVISVASNKFSDAAGNQNNDGADANNTASLSIDTVLPTIAITSDKAALKTGETATLTFTLSEASTDFDATDIVVSGGTLSNFTGSGTTYTATFTPTANSTTNGVVSVASNKFSDAAGNQNNDGADANNTASLAIDTVLPTIAITSDKSALKSGDTATITFTLSESSTDFDATDIVVSGGTLSNFTGSGTTYTATFTPTANSTTNGVISVASNQFSDAAGNQNNDGADANNTASLSIDTVLPTIAITSDKANLKAGDTATITFTLSEASTDFDASDIAVTGGTLSNFSGSGTTYTATFTPTANSTTNGVISVASNQFSDAAGNQNNDGVDADNTNTITIDTLRPTIAITSDKSALKAGETATLTFTLSESSTDFDATDVVVSGGTLSNFTGSGTTYTATFTPTANSTTNGVISVASNQFSDAAGNQNNDGADANNTASLTIDTVLPTIAITSDKSSLNSGDTATITFTLSETSTDFDASDIAVTGGTLSNFTGSGTTYTATFTPTANSTTNGVISVASNKFSDAAGNQNNDGADADNTTTIAIDSVLPTIAITSDKSALKVGETATLTFTLSEASADFDATDVVVSGGTLSNFTGSGTTYTATFTPTANSTTNGVVSVASNKFSDAAGNQNNDGADANNTASLSIDTILPTIAITSDKSNLKAGDTATLTFTLSEASTNFDATDVVVTGGTLSNFTGSGTTYTATFTPTANSTTNGVISVASNQFSDAAGNQNNDGADADNTNTLSIDTVLPTIAITSDKATLKAGETATLTFTLSEASTDFDASDINVTGGTLSNFTGSGTTYTATFTPTADSTANGVIHVDSTKFSDAAGNQNNDGADTNNTATITVDTLRPTIAITSDKPVLKAGDTATITFTLSEASTDFDATDIAVTGGTLSNFSGSGTTYTATFTPVANSTINGVIHVDSTKFSDAAGNQNNDGADADNTQTITIDSVPPTIAITSDKSALKAGETATLTFTLSETSTDFDASDIAVTGGTLSNFTGSGTTYTATFTPTANSTTNGVISVASNKFSDAAGNQNNDGADANNTISLTIDTVLPTIAITSDKSALKAGDTATLTFTLSEASADFDASDIVVSGGTLSNFTGSGTTYTATFTPTANSTTNGVISVASNKFSDAVGNQNNDGADADNTATLTIDSVLPTIAITSDKSALKAGDTATLTFTLSESSTDFDASDIVVTGGTLSNFTGSGTTYTATFTPTANSTTNGVISVASNKFSDAAGNQNTDGADADNTATLTIDSVPPTIAITSDKSNLNAGDTATITFTISEASTDFDASDIAVTGGTLSNFTGSGTTYTATFTPTANSTANGVISVASNKFSDAAGNQNNDGADADNTATLTIDSVLPTIAITSDKSALKAGDTATLTFTLSETSTDFDATDVVVTGGTLSNFTGSGTAYTATFTPTANSTANGVISVASNKFSDAAGNQNNDGADADNTATLTLDSVLPTIAITSDKPALKAGDTATITFTLSESSTDFDASDIVVSGGTLSNFTGSGTTYTATFTPTTNSTTNGVISVASNKFSDAAGNQNNDGADANNTTSLTIDSVLPTIAITSDKPNLKAGDTATITFTLSESSTDFDATDVVVTGGTLSNFTGSGTTYTATFTPDVNSTANGVISVASNKFSDAAGNQNNDGADADNTATLTIDSVLPTIAITSDKSALKAGDTATLTFTLSEASTDFDASNIAVTGGTLSNFTGSGTTYTATFTPTTNSTTNGVISVASNKFSDAAGNQNNDGADADNTATLTIDSVLPTIAIISDKPNLKAGDTATLTFTLSEASTDFDASDIAVTGGTLSNFTGSGTTYTATFTPDANSTTNGVISVASNQFSDAAGNQNNDGADTDNTATLTIDTVLPTIAIASDKSTLKAGETATLTFTLSEASTDFDASDIDVTGGTLSNFNGSGTTYTATFTPTTDSTANGVIHVDSTKFSDAVGNQNNDGADTNNTATITVDTLRPTIAIASDKSTLKAGDTATLTFTLSEASTDFDASDIDVTGGTLSNFSGSGTTYTATFTPTTDSTANGVIHVDSTKFSDAAGNQNNDGADTNNTATITVDTLRPTIAITSDKSALKAGDTATLTFTLSEASTDFDASDIDVTGGTLSNFSGSGTTYTATFTPTTDSTANGVIHVDSTKFSDAAGNQNNDGADTNNTATITVDTLRPTIAITSDKSALKAGDTATLTFTISESSTDFDASDIAVTGGTLSNFSGSGTTYTATFTPTANSTANGVISVASNKFSDAAGNQNTDGTDADNTATLTIDSVLPTIAITSDKSALKTGDTATITFTLSESSTDFDASDIVVSGGTLSNFTGSGTTYTATFTPTANSTANGVISVASNQFSDAAGNQNNDGADADNTATLTIDSVLPTIAITSDKSALKASDTATITFTLSESSTDFDAADVVVTGGTLSNFTGSGTTYTATFTPDANSTTNGIISVASNQFSDAAGNQNNDGTDADNTATLAIDTVPPTIAIASDKSTLKTGETATLTFTLSEASTDFDASDIDVTGGTLSNFSGSGTTYTATFTPTADSTANGVIHVDSTKFSDAVGNQNNDGADTNNTATITVDTLRPTIAIASDKSTLKTGETATITFTLSEVSTDFDASDIDVTGGTLSNFSGSGTTYTATFTPTTDSTANGVIHVDSTKFSDAAGNQNNDGAEPNNTATITVDTLRPTIAITSDKSFLKSGDTALLTFTLSEVSTDFDATDIVVSGGTLSNFSGSGTTYTATFTPTASSTTDGVISVASNQFSDAAGNQNNDGADADNSVTLTVNTLSPTVTITLSDDALIAGDTATVTFSFSEVPTDFDASDITAENGAITDLTVTSDPKVYTATFTPTVNIEDATNVISVGSGYTSPTGNIGIPGTSANYTIDTLRPTIAITSDKSALKAGETATITFTLSEASTDFDVADIAVTGGTLSNFVGKGTTYTATFTPTANSSANGTINVDSNKFSDAAGNQNDDGADADNTATLSIDTVPPTIAITSDKSNLKAGDTATITFTLSEVSPDFDASDIAVTGGTLSNLTGRGTIYTATFTPTANSTANGVISVASNKFSDVAGNQNNDGADANNTVTLAIDTAKPSIAINPIATDDIIDALEDDSPVTISGTTTGVENGQIVTVVLNGNTYSASVTNNSWTFDISPAEAQALDASETVTAKVQDLAGNPAIPATRTIFYSSSDTDGDGVPDLNDLDDDNDGIPDLDELSGDPNRDTDGDGIADPLDLDSDNDGIPDVKEGGGTDLNGDGIIDNFIDQNRDGLSDRLDPNLGGTPLPLFDTDGDGIRDFQDRDSDNDGILDVIEANGSDPDGDGIIGTGTPIDSDGNGLPDVVDPKQSGNPLAIPDTDGDQVPDYRDLDSDNDSIPDVIEAGGSDPDRDGVIGNGTPVDANRNGIEDSIDRAIGSNPLNPPDTDGDRIPNYRDLDSDNDGSLDIQEYGNQAFDQNGDGIVDGTDQDHDGLIDSIDGNPNGFGSAGKPLPASPDRNGNGTADYLEPPKRGDASQGSDRVTGGDENDILNGFSDLDILSGGRGDDIINGGSDKDVLRGDEGNDIVNGGSNDDDMQGGTDNDVLNGGTGNDRMLGNDGDDVLNGGRGRDYLDGGQGNDRITGNEENDRLIGGEGNDRLIGDRGNDRLVGGFGKDKMTGGQGRDKYIYNLVNDFGDVITDFEILKDRFDLKALFKSSGGSMQDVRFKQQGNNTLIQVDVGGWSDLALLQDVNADTLGSRHFKF